MPDLNGAFNDLKKKYPDRLGDAKLLSAEGRSALIAEHDDGTLTKILYRPDPAHEQQAQETLDNELLFTRHFSSNPLEGYESPILIGEPERLEDKDFFAMYRMTKVSGHGATWKHNKAPEFETQEQTDNHFRQAGQLLARFHKNTAGMVLPEESGNDGPQPGSHIMQVPTLDGETNAALARAEQYLQTHKKSVVGHRDFHGGNVMEKDDGTITGIIDFGRAGRWENRMMDFVNVPKEGYDAFVEGYERESGEKIDPMMMKMTEISFLASTINWEKDSEKRQKAVKELQDQLGATKTVTGYSQPTPSI